MRRINVNFKDAAVELNIVFGLNKTKKFTLGSDASTYCRIKCHVCLGKMHNFSGLSLCLARFQLKHVCGIICTVGCCSKEVIWKIQHSIRTRARTSRGF